MIFEILLKVALKHQKSKSNHQPFVLISALETIVLALWLIYQNLELNKDLI
jgi:hypothetical protein